MLRRFKLSILVTSKVEYLPNDLDCQNIACYRFPAQTLQWSLEVTILVIS